MSFYDRFIELCDRNNKKPNTVASEIGLSNATATGWKRGSIPKGETLEKLSAYFGVTIDYLLDLVNDPHTRLATQADIDIFFGGPDEGPSELCKLYPAEKKFIYDKFRRLSEESREYLDSTATFLLGMEYKHKAETAEYDDLLDYYENKDS